MSIAPPQLKPSFKFLLNAQRPIVASDSKPKICSTTTSNSLITQVEVGKKLLEVGKIALFTISCILVHVYAPAKLPALMALASLWPMERTAACAAVLMLLMHPDETVLSWIVSIVWLIPDMPVCAMPVCAMLILSCPSSAPVSVITYALSLARGLIYFATKKKCDAVLFSPSIPVLMFATCAIVLLDNNKRIVSKLKGLTASAMQPSQFEELSVIVEDDSSSLAYESAATDIVASNSLSKNAGTVKIQ